MHTGAVPWAQRRLRPTRTWQLARGNGVVVAVLGSGIDSRNGQFAAGQVLPGRDLLGAGPADDDCDGSGTFVAGLVAARPDPSTTVVGMAPDAVLLPVRIMQTTANASDPPSAALVAQGIDYAVAAQADIVVVYEAAAGASDRLERAVAAAHLAGVIVVAGGRSARSTQDDGAMLYPCGYAAAVAVAAVDGSDEPVHGSCSGARLDVAAPGASLISTAAGAAGRVRHVSVGEGAPGYAAGYVAGALALLLSYEPTLTPDAAVARLTDTADRPPTTDRDDRLGWGVVNPYTALSTVRRTDRRAPVPPGEVTVAVARPPAATDLAPVVTGASLAGAAAALLTLAMTVRGGRSRRWRPGRRSDAAATDQRG